MVKKLLFMTALCLALNACNEQDKQNEYDDYDYDGIAKKDFGVKLPRPNAENPPIIGVLGEVYWEKQK